MRAHVPRWRRGLQNRVWWVQFPTVRAIGVTSCLAAARSVSLRKWSCLCAVRKRQDEVIYVLAGTGFVKMNGCDRRTGAGLKSSVVGLGTTVFERNPRRGCGVVAPDRLCKQQAMRWQTAVWDASQIVCLLQRISPWWMLCMLAGHIAHGGNILGEAKARYRRANDKGQWWEAGASDKTR